jgi:hypothetical protein
MVALNILTAWQREQDIAFFDGNTSGQLTSRLSNDANTMVSPIQVQNHNLFVRYTVME